MFPSDSTRWCVSFLPRRLGGAAPLRATRGSVSRARVPRWRRVSRPFDSSTDRRSGSAGGRRRRRERRRWRRANTCRTASPPTGGVRLARMRRSEAHRTRRTVCSRRGRTRRRRSAPARLARFAALTAFFAALRAARRASRASPSPSEASGRHARGFRRRRHRHRPIRSRPRASPASGGVAALRTCRHLVPASLPLLPPRERPVAHHARLHREVLLLHPAHAAARTFRAPVTQSAPRAADSLAIEIPAPIRGTRRAPVETLARTTAPNRRAASIGVGVRGRGGADKHRVRRGRRSVARPASS